jgi:hypothetical protein
MKGGRLVKGSVPPPRRCGPRLKVQIDGKNAIRLGPDHPNEAIGILALMQAIGTTILLSMRA